MVPAGNSNSVIETTYEYLDVYYRYSLQIFYNMFGMYTGA